MRKPIFNSYEQACKYCGILEVAQPPAGCLIRTSTESHPRSKNGFVLSFNDGGAMVGNWENDTLAIYSINVKRRLSQSEIDKLAIERVRAKRQREEELRKHTENIRLIRDFFSHDLGAYPTSSMEWHGAPRHPYLERKAVGITETIYETTRANFEYFFGQGYQRLPEGRLLVLPLFNGKNLVSFQLIDEAGKKYFLKNGMTKGAYWKATCNPVERGAQLKVHIAEGVATILSVLQNTDHSGIFLSCMNAGNIQPVCQRIKELYPNIPIIIWADKDIPKEGDTYGIGINKAREAEDNLGGGIEICAPPFTDDDYEQFKEITRSEKAPSDWNDFYLIRGPKHE